MRSSQPVALTLEETDRRNITLRLKAPLLAFALAYGNRRLALWLGRQTLVEAWQFIEMPTQVLRQRIELSGPRCVANLNELLAWLKLPPLGTPIDNVLIARRLSYALPRFCNTNEDSLLLFALHRTQQAYIESWHNLPDVGTRRLYNEHCRLELLLGELGRRYVDLYVNTQQAD